MMMFGALDTDGRTNGFPHVSWDQWALVVFSGGDKFGEASDRGIVHIEKDEHQDLW